MITMLGLFIVVTYVEQRLIVLPNTAGKKELYGSNPCFTLSFIELPESTHKNSKHHSYKRCDSEK